SRPAPGRDPDVRSVAARKGARRIVAARAARTGRLGEDRVEEQPPSEAHESGVLRNRRGRVRRLGPRLQRRSPRRPDGLVVVPRPRRSLASAEGESRRRNERRGDQCKKPSLLHEILSLAASIVHSSMSVPSNLYSEAFHPPGWRSSTKNPYELMSA